MHSHRPRCAFGNAYIAALTAMSAKASGRNTVFGHPRARAAVERKLRHQRLRQQNKADNADGQRRRNDAGKQPMPFAYFAHFAHADASPLVSGAS